MQFQDITVQIETGVNPLMERTYSLNANGREDLVSQLLSQIAKTRHERKTK